MLITLSPLIVLTLSLLVTRVASVALVHTGMSAEGARFQARSAFTGVGFTTGEAESIVGHPVRRRIVMWLMMAGNVGLVTAVSTLLLSVADRDVSWKVLLAVFGGGAVALSWAARSAWLDQRLSRTISWALNRWSNVDARDYARLLHVREDYGVSELRVQSQDWIAGKTLTQARLAGEGILVLGIQCPGGSFIGAPPVDTEIRDGDTLVLYGRTQRIAEIDGRSAGESGKKQHDAAVGEHDRLSRDARSRAGR